MCVVIFRAAARERWYSGYRMEVAKIKRQCAGAASGADGGNGGGTP